MVDRPSTMLDSPAVCVAIFLIISSYLLRHLLHNGRPPLPPGPSLISLIGEVLQPSSSEENIYSRSRWAHQYGDIVHMSIFNRHMIIINSVQIAVDMLESKGSIYSGRDLSPMLKLSGWGDFLTFVQPGAYFRQQRGYIHKLLGTQKSLSQHYHVIENESRTFLRRVLSSPENLADCVRCFVGSIGLQISYGYTAKEKEDPFVFAAERSAKEISLAGAPDSLPWIVDLFPILEKLPDWFPGTHFKKLAGQWSEDARELKDSPFEFVKEQMAAGTAMPSFASTLLADDNLTSDAEHAIKLASVAIGVAGLDTILSTIRGFFLAMALNPAVFKRAQEEIDTVVGARRLPSISDRIHLPYADALIREVYRWIVAVPSGAPHKISQDDVHAGYFIPKGSIIVPNIRFMMNDPRLYKDPERFMPERFLGDNPEKDPREMAFGFGRRQCPGRLFADETVFIACVMSLTVFNIHKKTKDGLVVEPVRRMTTGFFSHLVPYEIDVKPRSTQAAMLIQAAAQAEGT